MVRAMKVSLALILLITSFSSFAKDTLRSKLRPFLDQNAHEQLSFITDLGFDIYKIHMGQDANAFMVLIPEAPSEKFKQFIFGFKEEGTLGLYLPSHNHSFNLMKGTILVSNQAGPWTVAHELAHALLDKSRGKQDESKTIEDLGNAKEDYEEAMSLYNQLGFFPSEVHAARAFESMVNWSTIQLLLLKQFELEEVFIERTLRTIYEEERLPVLASDYDHAKEYLDKNCARAQVISDHLVEVFYHLTPKLGESVKSKLGLKVKAHETFLLEGQSEIKHYCD